MKIRVGYGLGTRSDTNDADRFTELVDTLEALRFDSLWLSEKVTDTCPDPVVGMAFAAGRTTKLKFGTSVMVLPGRNPMLLAKELASLDRLSNGRLLPAFGLGQVDPAEQQAFGVDRTERGRRFDEMLPLVRRFWEEDSVDHDGEFFQFSGARVVPKPVQDPVEVWFGGISRHAIRRTGQFGDGWLPSFCTPDDVSAARPEIDRIAAEHDRSIDPEHFGALVPYADGEIPEVLGAVLSRRRPDLEVGDVVADDLTSLRAMLERFVEVGASKFVVVPISEPASWSDHLSDVHDVLAPIQT